MVIEKQTISRIVIEEEETAPSQLQPQQKLPRWQQFPHMSLMAIGGILLVVGALGWISWTRWMANKGQVRSLVVLPFLTLTQPTPDSEQLGIGLADALITRLSNAGGIIVRPTSAVMAHTGRDRDALALARKMGVDAVLDGHLQRSGEQIRLTVQLLRTEDGTPLWADSIEEPTGSLFGLQRSVSEKLAHVLILKLNADQQQKLKKDYTANAAAFEAYTRGRYFYGKQNKEAFEKALEYFRQAIELDPNYALAWAGIADCYNAQSTTITSLGATPHETLFTEARAAAERAIALDETLADAHVSLGAVLAGDEGEAPHRELKRAIELNPNLPQAHNIYALILTGEARLTEALAEIDQARALDPLSLSINTNRGNILFRLRRYDEAVNQYRKVLEMDQNFVRARYGLGIVLGLQKRYDEAIAELQKTAELTKGASVPLSALGYVYGVSGQRAETEQVLAQLLEKYDQKLVSPLYVALVYLGLGDKEQAFNWMSKLAGKHMVRLAMIDERFDPIRDDSRIQSLLPK